MRDEDYPLIIISFLGEIVMNFDISFIIIQMEFYLFFYYYKKFFSYFLKEILNIFCVDDDYIVNKLII